MSAAPIEVAEPVPSATISVSDDANVQKANGDSAPADKDVEMPDEVKEPTNGAVEDEEAKDNQSAEVEKDESDTKAEVKKDESVTNAVGKKDEQSSDNKRPYNNKLQYKNHSKYDPSVLEATSDENTIKAQVEFYFSDSNLPTDTHLWRETDGSSNKPVAITEIMGFGRMKRFAPYYEQVVAALRKSPALIVEGEAGKETVKRTVAYDPHTTRPRTEARSVYVKGFGEEEPSSQFDIEAFFAPYGVTNAVRLRRSEDRLFKGSVFVEFADEETATKFLALDPKPLWKGKHELEIIPKKDYVQGKIELIKDGKMEPRGAFVPRGRGGGRGGRGRGGNFRGKDRDDRNFGRDKRDRDGGDRDPNDWKKRREQDRSSNFKDNKNRNSRGGRGGNRGGRDDRGPRNDRNKERSDDKSDDKPKATEETSAPVVTEGNKSETAVENKKRAREEDNGADEAPAKKVDTKTEITADAS